MKILWTLILNILLFSCVAQVLKDTTNYGVHLRYQNYDEEITRLPDDIIEMTNQSTYWDPCFFHIKEIFSSKEKKTLILLKYFLDNRKFICLDSKKITHPQLDFLLEQKIINYYIGDDYFAKNYAVAMGDFYDFWYLGKITLNPKYESHLILTRDRDSRTIFIDCSLFLMNIKDRQLLSITRIALYHNFAGHGFFQYLKPEKNNTFSYRGISHSDMIDGRRLYKWKNREKEEVYAKFMFDDQGYVNVLWNKLSVFKYRIKEEDKWKTIYRFNEQGNIVAHKKDIFSKTDSMDNILVQFPDTFPEFPGGVDELMKFVKQNIVYPKEAQKKGIEDHFFAVLTIEVDGSVSEIELINKIGYGCEEEALRVLFMMPKWKPGQVNGENVRTLFTIPVRFSQ
jgi:hypothetical protein